VAAAPPETWPILALPLYPRTWVMLVYGNPSMGLRGAGAGLFDVAHSLVRSICRPVRLGASAAPQDQRGVASPSHRHSPVARYVTAISNAVMDTGSVSGRRPIAIALPSSVGFDVTWRGLAIDESQVKPTIDAYRYRWGLTGTRWTGG
jgi:hypothetical protein